MINNNETVILPLYSEKGGIHVPEKSGLNQWNAYGRPRNYNEVYISIPRFIHEWFSGFFPGRDKIFTLVTNNGKQIFAKVCQDNSKALMSNPNSELGEWILREVLHLKNGQLLTYEMLEEKQIDSVAIEKIDNNCYKVSIAKFNAYEEQKVRFRKA